VGLEYWGLDWRDKEIVDRTAPLTEYAWKFRYPGKPAQPSKKEAKQALAVATEVFEEMLKRLPKEVRR